MKKLLVLLSLCAFGFNAYPQGKTWSKVIDIGAIGQFRTSWLVNQNVSDASGHQDYVFSFAGGGGVRVQYFGSGSVGFGGEFNYATINQKYEGLNTSVTGNYESQTQLKCYDIPLFIKFGSSNGGYFEVGGQYSIISSANHTTTFALAPNTGDVSSTYKGSYFAPFIGFGGSINLWRETILLNMGMRMAYGVNDVIGVDGLGQDLTEDHAVTYSPVNPVGYSDYKKTNVIYGAISMGLIYSIALE